MKNNKHYKWIIYMIVAIMLVSVTGCKDETPADQEAPDTTTEGAISQPEEEVEEPVVEIEPEEEEPEVIEPTYGGTIKLAIQNPVTLSPVENLDKSTDEILRLVYEPLFEYNEAMIPEAKLVDTYNYDATNNSLSLSLKSDILFHGGETLTTEDVRYTIEALMKNNSVYSNQVNMVDYVDVVDELNMIIYFKENYAFYLYDMTFPIVSSVYETSEGFDSLIPNGTGPYKYESFTAMQELTLVLDESWQGDMPYISTIECLICRDEEAELTAFDEQLVDVFVPTQLDWRTYSEIDVKPIEFTSEYMNFIGFNHDHDLLGDLLFRQAIAYALDREAMLEAWYLGHGVIADSLIHPESDLFTGEVFYNFETEQSKELFLQLGLIDGDNNGFLDDPVEGGDLTLRLLVNSNSETRNGMSGMVKNYLEAVGVLVTIESLPSSTFNTARLEGDFDLILTGWKMPAKPDFTGLFHSQYIDWGYNFINYSNEMMDAVLENVYTTDYDFLADQVQDFNELYVSDLPYLTIGFVNSAVLTQADVYGSMTPSTDHVYDGFEGLFTIE